MRTEYNANRAMAASVPLVLPITAVVRSMKGASRAGIDPYNSHSVQSAKWQRAWTDKARRSR